MIARRTLLARTAGTITAAGLAGAGAGPAAAASRSGTAGQVDEDFVAFVTMAADRRAAEVLTGYGAQLAEVRDLGRARAAARGLRTLTSVYVHDASRYHQDGALLGPLEELADALAEAQYDDGLWDQGAVHSPPDTAFSVVDLNLAFGLLERDGRPATGRLRATVERMLRSAGPGLAHGGVHTANHRWLVCAALARVHHRWPDASYARRIEAWLAEGIDQLAGGEYSERSPTYSAVVTNPALLTLARHYDRADLYARVRDNLVASLYVTEPNGEVESVHSRRQDQAALRYLPEFWLQYRELAIRYGDGRFWSSMDFPHRPKEWRGLRTDVTVREMTDGGWELDFEVRDSAVPLALELCFRRGGELTGRGLEPVAGTPTSSSAVRRRTRWARTGSSSVRATARAASSPRSWTPASATPGSGARSRRTASAS
ncbi:hypothetical protein [Streptomyces sp. NPDC095613]|uniref:hypothetical protein n=1 Tax=Streptomyces sp. NPDC095613 TaxID=3155540 RepID=UPI003321AE59